MRRSSPAAPASRSRSSPVAAPRAPSNAPTPTPAVTSPLGLDEAEVAVRAPIEDSHRVGLGIPKHEEVLLTPAEREQRIVERHGLHGLTAAPHDARAAHFWQRFGDERRGADRAARTPPRLPAITQPGRLLRHFLDRCDDGRRQARMTADAVQHVIAARVDRQLDDEQLPLTPDAALRRHGAVVEHTIQTMNFSADAVTYSVGD